MHTAAARLNTSRTATGATGSAVVLIVSSDPRLRASAELVALRDGYRTITARHAGHAVLACLTHRVDIVATELSMDEMSGPALVARLRRLNPDLAAVYFGNAGTRECDGILVRPFTSQDLVRALAAARRTITPDLLLR